MLEPRFRPGTIDDLVAVSALMADYYAEDGYSYDAIRAATQLRRFVTSPQLGRLWVAQIDGQIVGYLILTFGFSFEYGGRDAFIDEVFIAAPFRGKGLGREAMAVAQTCAQEHGVRALHLEVEPHRTAAASLYASVGFTESPRRLMTKRLHFDGELVARN